MRFWPASLLLLAACSETPAEPGDPRCIGRMSATIDGTPWVASCVGHYAGMSSAAVTSMHVYGNDGEAAKASTTTIGFVVGLTRGTYPLVAGAMTLNLSGPLAESGGGSATSGQIELLATEPVYRGTFEAVLDTGDVIEDGTFELRLP